MDKDDIQGQVLFFSPTKVKRARQRFREREEIEQREKQTKADQRLQRAILKAERHQENEERRTALTAQLVTIKKEKGRLTAEKRTEREQQQNQRAVIKAQRRQEIENAK